MVAAGDRVADRFSSRGTHQQAFAGVPATGKTVTGSGMDFFRIVDGKIAERWLEADMRGFLQQIGALPTPPPPAG